MSIVKGYQMPAADSRRSTKTPHWILQLSLPVTAVGGRRLISLEGGNRGRCTTRPAVGWRYGDLNCACRPCMGLERHGDGLQNVQPSERQHWGTIAGGRKAVIEVTAGRFWQL